MSGKDPKRVEAGKRAYQTYKANAEKEISELRKMARRAAKSREDKRGTA